MSRGGAAGNLHAVATPAISKRNIEMSSSNLAVRLEHAATDALSQPPVLKVRDAANDERVMWKSAPRLSFTSRKLVVRDQGLRLLRIC
jgi:hypothetical protein